MGGSEEQVGGGDIYTFRSAWIRVDDPFLSSNQAVSRLNPSNHRPGFSGSGLKMPGA